MLLTRQTGSYQLQEGKLCVEGCLHDASGHKQWNMTSANWMQHCPLVPLATSKPPAARHAKANSAVIQWRHEAHEREDLAPARRTKCMCMFAPRKETVVRLHHEPSAAKKKERDRNRHQAARRLQPPTSILPQGEIPIMHHLMLLY